MASYTLDIPGWHPALLNRLMRGHWAAAHRLKKADAQLVGGYALAQGVPRAQGKRRVRVRLEGWPRGRLPDADAPLKSLLDGLVSCGMLVDDSPRWCEWAPPEYARAGGRRTVITLEDVGDGDGDADAAE